MTFVQVALMLLAMLIIACLFIVVDENGLGDAPESAAEKCIIGHFNELWRSDLLAVGRGF